MKTSFIEKRPYVKRGQYMYLIREAIAKQKTLKIEFDSVEETAKKRRTLANLISQGKMPISIHGEKTVLYLTPR